MITETFTLRPNDDFIQLIQLLKLKSIASSGGEAKMIVAEGLVKVNGQIELRKTNKLRAGDLVELENVRIKIV